MNTVIRLLTKTGILQSDIDYHLIRASMVLIFLSFGYQKWFEYEAQVLIPFISNGPLIFWLYPAFAFRGPTWFLGVSEWLFGTLLFLGFWDKRLGILGATGSTFTFCGHRHHHSFHAEWMGSRCRVSCNGRKRCFPHEGCRPSRRIHLPAEAGSGSGVRLHQTRRPSPVAACLVARTIERDRHRLGWARRAVLNRRQQDGHRKGFLSR